MYTTIDINANELSPEIIDSIKMSYRDKNIRIEIFEIDETEYLLSSPKNREILLQRKKTSKPARI
ncbi:MAG: hypothetical protein ACLFQX_09210 [Candidatus Kapaibacterium sp.]